MNMPSHKDVARHQRLLQAVRRARDATPEPTPDGKFHIIEASFTMAANYTGVQITPEFLSTSLPSIQPVGDQFNVCGSGRGHHPVNCVIGARSCSWGNAG